MAVLILVGLMAVLAATIFVFLDRRYSTWKRRGVPGPPASVFSLAVPKVMLGQESIADVAERVYKEYRDCPIVGTYLFTNPILHINDPEVIKHVLIKEFQDFSGRGHSKPREYDPLSKNLFLLSGQRWRNLRVKLAPTFTSGKIKYMFETIRSSSANLADYLEERVTAGGGSHCEDARRLMMRLFVDIISSVEFGIDSNVVKNIDSEFYRAGREAVAPTKFNAFRALVTLFAPGLMSLLRIKSNSEANTRFFTELVQETIQFREENNVDRADMLNMLIQLKNQGFVAPDKDGDKEDGEVHQQQQQAGGEATLQKLTMDHIAANVFVFFVAGFESSSGTVSFTLYEMAKNRDILDRALREVDRVLADFNGEITYESVTNMSYLEKCVSETLRKYPPLPFVSRTVQRTRKVPLTDAVVDKGTHIIVPIRALHHDAAYWPDPERYDPERFSEEEKSRRPAQAYMPFGDGPRMCIAARLGMVQMKTALVTLLSKYTVSLPPDAPDKIELDPKTFATTPSGSLNVTFHPRHDVQRNQARH